MPETAQEELTRRLAAYPKEALPYLKHGFVEASNLSEEVRRLVLAEMIENFKRGTRRLDSSALGEVTKLPERESEQIASVYSLVIGLLSESAANPSEFVEAAKGVLFFPEQAAVAKSIAAAVCASRDEIKKTVARTQLAGEVLPSLYTFDLAVDLRIRVVDGKVVTSAPVAVVHIDTDAEDHEIWVQLGRGDIESMIRTLSKALEDMKIAETLTGRKT
ncbi:MAG TPA: hypothetical protein VIQ05_07390 [Tardiphaga sp.]